MNRRSASRRLSCGPSSRSFAPSTRPTTSRSCSSSRTRASRSRSRPRRTCSRSAESRSTARAPSCKATNPSAGLTWAIKQMQEFIQQVVSGLASGGIFASLALALVLIYNAMGLVNFAQGEMAMFATFIAYTLISHGVNYFIAFPLTLGLAFVGGVLIERAPVLTLVIVTLGLATLINGAAGFLFGYTPNYFSSPFSTHTVNIFGAFASYQDLSVIVVSAIVLVAIYLLLQRTTLGLTLRAAAHHPEASRLLGVRVSWMLALGWGLASAVGAVSGIMVAPILLLEPNMMQTIIIYAFAAAVLGGIDSPLGAVVGGLIVGVTVNLVGAYLVGGDLELAVALAIKPNGLFGRAAARNV